jgi:hypothetical protein
MGTLEPLRETGGIMTTIQLDKELFEEIYETMCEFSFSEDGEYNNYDVWEVREKFEAAKKRGEVIEVE